MDEKDIKVFFIDVETSGFSKENDRILDIGIIYEKNGMKLDELQVYIKLDSYPDGYEKAQEIHGITPEFLKIHGISELDAYKQIISFFDKYINKFDKNDKALFAGHNAPFDKRMLEALFLRQGNKFFYSYFEKDCLDVLKLSREANKSGLIKTIDNKLGTIAEYLDVDLSEAHSALADITATRKVYQKLKMLEEDRLKNGFI